jgi:hypothetical protein
MDDLAADLLERFSILRIYDLRRGPLEWDDALLPITLPINCSQPAGLERTSRTPHAL